MLWKNTTPELNSEPCLRKQRRAPEPNSFHFYKSSAALHSPRFFGCYSCSLFCDWECVFYCVRFWTWVTARVYPTRLLAWVWMVCELQMKLTNVYVCSSTRERNRALAFASLTSSLEVVEMPLLRKPTSNEPLFSNAMQHLAPVR